jgi:hypothetical protein
MGVIKGSLISVSENDDKKVENLKIKDDILSLKKTNGLLNYKYYKKSLTLKHIENDYIYSNSHIYYQWNFKVNRYYIINDKLSITLEHIIYVRRNNINTWQNVKSLEIGDKLLKSDLTFEEIIKIDEIFEDIEVYSINLDGCFNYFCDGYLLHNAGICDQGLSFWNNIGDSNTQNFSELDLPSGSCAYCGIDDKYFWLGPNRYNASSTRLSIPIPKYLINSFGSDFASTPIGLKDSGTTFVYRPMPRKWYDSSQLRIPNRQLNKYYHVYLHKDGNWKSTDPADNQDDNMPEPTDIYPHNLKILFDNGSWSSGTGSYGRFDSYHSYISGGARVLLDDSTDTSNWIPYGSNSQSNLFHNAQTNQSGNQRYAESTQDASGKGGDVDHWEKVRFCFTFYKTNNSYDRTITGSLDGINTQNYTASYVRWRFVNIKGGTPGNPHPYSGTSVNSSVTYSGPGGYSDSNDNHHWGLNFFSIALDNLTE